jgi:N-acetylglutamate synthase and related acetyltransferases
MYINPTNQPPQARVIEFSPEYAPAFESLNRQWIEQHFTLEEPDRAVLADPYGTIVAPGGQVFFVLADGQALGTCAVIRLSDEVFELAKMAVDPRARGRGYGDLLMEAAIEFARRAGAKTLMLVSNSQLEPALRLYAKHGFHYVPLQDNHGYARADVGMELDLT